MIKLKQTTGFTLIELLITISIILLVTGAGIAGFINFNDRQQVQTTVNNVKDLMSSAKVKARAGEGASGLVVSEGCVAPNKLKGYEVVEHLTLPAVVLNRVCVNPLGVVFSTTERSIVTLDNVDFSITNSVTFLSLRGGVDTGGGDVTITVNGKYATSIIYEFQVLQTGEITAGAFE